jgi:hypothetical protein
MRNPANLIGHMNSQVEHKERRDHVRGGECGDKEVPETAENDKKFPDNDAPVNSALMSRSWIKITAWDGSSDANLRFSGPRSGI